MLLNHKIPTYDYVRNRMYNSLLTEISLIMMKGSDSDFLSLEYNRCHRFLQKNNQNLFCCKTGTRKWKINAKFKKKKKYTRVIDVLSKMKITFQGYLYMKFMTPVDRMLLSCFTVINKSYWGLLLLGFLFFEQKFWFILCSQKIIVSSYHPKCLWFYVVFFLC